MTRQLEQQIKITTKYKVLQILMGIKTFSHDTSNAIMHAINSSTISVKLHDGNTSIKEKQIISSCKMSANVYLANFPHQVRVRPRTLLFRVPDCQCH